MVFIIEDFDIASYANDNTPHVVANNMDGVVKYIDKPLPSCLNYSVII